MQLNLGEVLVIVDEHTSVGTQDDATMAVLRDAVKTIGVGLSRVVLALSHGPEVVAVKDVEPIAGGNPGEIIYTGQNRCDGSVHGELVLNYHCKDNAFW